MIEPAVNPRAMMSTSQGDRRGQGRGDVDEYEDGARNRHRTRVAESDLGKVIGRSGRVARALRNILSAAGSKLDKRYALEIIE